MADDEDDEKDENEDEDGESDDEDGESDDEDGESDDDAEGDDETDDEIAKKLKPILAAALKAVGGKVVDGPHGFNFTIDGQDGYAGCYRGNIFMNASPGAQSDEVVRSMLRVVSYGNWMRVSFEEFGEDKTGQPFFSSNVPWAGYTQEIAEQALKELQALVAQKK